MTERSPQSPAPSPEREAATPRLPPTPRHGSSLLRIMGTLLVLGLLVAVAVPLGLYAALRTESGTAWVLGHVPGLVVTAPRGTLLGGDFAAERIEAWLPGPGDQLVLEQPAWEGLEIGRSPDPGTWLAVRMRRLGARSASLTLAPRPPSPASDSRPPQSLRLPVSLQVDALALDEFRSPALGTQPVRGLSAQLRLGAEGGARHHIEALRLQWDRLAAEGSLQIGSDAPLPVEARLQLRPVTATAPAAAAPPVRSAAPARATPSAPSGTLDALDGWHAELRLSGPLASPRLQATAQHGNGAAVPLLEATAGLRPFAAWPLADLRARTRGLDLAAFVSAAPRTALDGEATVRATGLDQAASADIRLDNTAAGPWNEGRLPVRQLRLLLQGRPDQPQVATIERFEAELGASGRPAGRISGRGGIDHGRWTVDATLDGLAPQWLDARAAAMRLGGTLSLSGQAADAASTGTSAGTGPGAGQAPNTARASEPMLLSARAALSGRMAGAPTTPVARRSARAARAATQPPATSPELRLSFDSQARLGPGGALQFTLKQAEARAGGARAQLSGSLARTTDLAPWQLKAQATLSDFDPRPWWAGPADSPWRRGPHRLNADTTLDLQWDAGQQPGTTPPSSTASTAPAASRQDPTAALLAWLAPWRGQAALQLKPSVLAGVPMEGNASLQARGAQGSPVDATLALLVSAAGNRLEASGLSRADRPAADRWQLKLDAPALGQLAPAAALFGLLPASTSAGVTTGRSGTRVAASPGPGGLGGQLSGQLSGQASLSGRWPGVRSEGRLDATGLRAGTLALQRGELRWLLGTQADAPAELQGRFSQLSIGGTAADAVELKLEGKARAHQLTLIADSRALPPAWATAAGAAGGATNGSLPALGNGSPQAEANSSLQVAKGAAPAASASAALTPGPGTRSVPGPVLASRATPVVTPASTGPGPTRVELRADGGLLFQGSSALSATGWRGRVQALDARSGQGAAALGLRSRDVALELAWPGAGPARLAVQPGRVELQAGATQAALRWSRFAWQAGSSGGTGASSSAGAPSGGSGSSGSGSPTGMAAAPGAPIIELDAELEPLAVAPLLARLQPSFGWGGDLQVGGKLVLRSAPRLRADIVLERQRGDLSVTDEIGTEVLGLSDLRLALNADNGVWSFTQALAGTNIGVAAGAVVARTGSATAWPTANTPIQGVLELRVANLGAWGPWVPAGWRLGGTLRTSASIGGRLGAPEYTGELRGNALTVRNFAEGVSVADGEVLVRLQGSSARIETFTARAGNGSLSLAGGASFGAKPEADLQLKADKFQLLGRVDRRIVASGNGRLQFNADRLTMDGQFGVDEGLIDFTRGDAPSLSDDVVVVRPPKGSSQPAAVAQRVDEQKAGAAASRIGSEAATAQRSGTAAAAPRAAPARAVALNIGVNLGERLRLRGRGLDTGLRGELRITSPAGRMAVNGTVSTQDGTYQAYGQKLTIDRGSIVFTGLVENPRLDIEATRPNTDVRVGVTVSGTASSPRIRLFSQPELPEVDKLSWLVLGRATDGLGRTDTALLQRAALALLSGEGPGVTDRLFKAVGLDDVSLRQSDGEVRETVITLGKQLSQRWYVGYERGLNATTGSWQLIYRIAQRLTLRAQSGLENSLDVIWTWRWQ